METVNNIGIIKKYCTYILIICCILECFFYYDTKNLYGCIATLYGWLLIMHVSFRRKNLLNFCLPTLAMLGYAFMYFFLPIIVTLIEAKPLTFNFEVPISFWNNLIINVTVVVLSYLVSLKLYNKTNWLTWIWTKLGYYKVPKEREIWMLSIIGLVCLLYYASQVKQNTTYEDLAAGAEGGFVDTAIQSLYIYAVMPLCLLFKRYYGDYTKPQSKNLIWVWCIIVLTVCIISTTRRIIVQPVLSLVIIFLLYVIIEGKKIMRFKTFILCVIGFYLITGPVADLFMAMSINRNTDNAKDFGSVINLYNDKQTLHSTWQYIELLNNYDSNAQGWSEYYVDNILLDRFCNLRVQDASLWYAEELGFKYTPMQKYAEEEITQRIPTAITRMLGLKKMGHTSPADVLVCNYFGDDYGLGQKVGGDIGIGLSWLGYTYYPVAFIIYILTFLFIATLTRVFNNKLVITIYLLPWVSKYFMFFCNGVGIFKSIRMLVRDGWQDIIIFCLIMWLIRLISRLSFQRS